MRVISGKYKGKNLLGFNIKGTRPTMDRVKESIFAMIQINIKNSVCLDLFAGSGSMGIEALSNGAKKCVFVDNNITAITIIKKNTEFVKEDIKIYNLDYKQALNKFGNDNLKFDLIFIDPPYDNNIIENIIKQIDELNILNKNGLIICESTVCLIDYFSCIKTRKISDKWIKIYRK
ncbi:MAG: 16S rRNA (guanine(966)-N(2))-methyltransferase RsmD [Bacilli bacterium]